MKKTIAIIAALAVTAVIAFAGCKKEEAAKPAMQSTVTSTATTTAPASATTSTAPAAAPATHEKKGC